MKSKKWFVDRIGTKIKNTTLNSVPYIIDEGHAIDMYDRQKTYHYRYSDLLVIQPIVTQTT